MLHYFKDVEIHSNSPILYYGFNVYFYSERICDGMLHEVVVYSTAHRCNTIESEIILYVSHIILKSYMHSTEHL